MGIESREVIGQGNESFEKDLINRENDLQKQLERERIDRSKYNKKYKEKYGEQGTKLFEGREYGMEERR